MTFQPFVTGLIALQFVAFGWRINREVMIEDKGAQAWLPASDWLNICSLVAVSFGCAVWPIFTERFGQVARTILAVGYVLIAFHPISQAAHYRLFSPKGRSIYRKPPWMTDQEYVSMGLSVFAAMAMGAIAWQATR